MGWRGCRPHRYGYAKLAAERLVRQRAEAADRYDCVCINPVVVFGPCLTKAHTKASPSFVRQFLYGNKIADAWISVVDVREAADAHLAALRRPECAGKRYIIADDTSSARMSSLATQTVAACPDRVP